jgi:hypothetical protein
LLTPTGSSLAIVLSECVHLFLRLRAPGEALVRFLLFTFIEWSFGAHVAAAHVDDDVVGVRDGVGLIEPRRRRRSSSAVHFCLYSNAFSRAVRIDDLETEGFEAALITDELKSSGTILVASNRARQRKRFSIAHELGHFLIPSHLPRPGEPSLCSPQHLGLHNLKEDDRRRRIEAEANRFAALLLMPPSRASP